MADIPADAGKGMGAFEQLHGLADGAAFSSYLAREAQLCHGAVGHAFLQWAKPGMPTRWPNVCASNRAPWRPSRTPGKASGQGGTFCVGGRGRRVGDQGML